MRKFTHDGMVTLTVAAEPATRKRMRLITLTDSGMG